MKKILEYFSKKLKDLDRQICCLREQLNIPSLFRFGVNQEDNISEQERIFNSTGFPFHIENAINLTLTSTDGDALDESTCYLVMYPHDDPGLFEYYLKAVLNTNELFFIGKESGGPELVIRSSNTLDIKFASLIGGKSNTYPSGLIFVDANTGVLLLGDWNGNNNSTYIDIDDVSNRINLLAGIVNYNSEEVATIKYKKYVALLSQSGFGNPTATILENTIGNIVWTRQAQGQYIGTLLGAFTNNKTACFGNFQLLVTDCAVMHIGRQSNDIVKYMTYENGLNLNEQNGDIVVEIRVYP